MFEHIYKKLTYSDIYNWGRVVTLKGREMFSLKVANVALANECAAFVNSTKKCSLLSADVKVNHTTTINVHYAFAHTKLPVGWF